MKRIIFYSILIALVLLLAWSASGIRLDEDVMNLLPDRDREIGRLRNLLQQFGFSNRALFLIESDPLDFHAADSLVKRLDETGLFTDVQARWSLGQLQEAIDFLRQHRTALMDEKDMLDVAGRFRKDEIRARLEGWKKKLTLSFDPFTAKTMASDPLELDSLLTGKLLSMQSSGIVVENGWLITPQRDAILVTAQPKSSGTDRAAAIEMVEAMDRIADEFPNVEIRWLSGHRFTYENSRRIQRDVSLTVTISLIMIVLLSILAYRRPYFILLTLVPALFGSLAALGVIRIFIPTLSAVIAGTGAMLIGIAVDYGIHILYHIDGEKGITRRRMDEITRSLRKPLFLGAGTTLAAFLALQFSILPVYRHLGIFVGIGIVASALFSVYVLPALVRTGKSVRRRPLIDLDDGFEAFFRVSERFGKWMLLPILLVSLLVLPGFLKVRFEGDLQALNATSDQLADDWQRIQDRFSGVMPSTLAAFSRETSDDALVVNQSFMAYLDSLQSDGTIQSYRSIAPLLPSMEAQRENILRWHRFFNDRELMRIRIDFEDVCSDLRIRYATFEPFLASLERSSEVYRFDDIDATLLKQMISGYLTDNTVLTGIDAGENPEAVERILRERFDDVAVYNGEVFIGKVTRTIYRELVKISLIALLLVTVVVTAFGRKKGRSLLLLLPLLVTLYWTFGILGTLGIAVNLINCVVSIFIFGLVIDYCIFLSESRESRTRSSGAILVSALTTMFALGSLVLAHHPALHSLGLTALIGILCGLVAVFLLIPMLFPATRNA